MGERGRQGAAPGIIPGGREEVNNMGERGRQGAAPGIIPGGEKRGTWVREVGKGMHQA